MYSFRFLKIDILDYSGKGVGDSLVIVNGDSVTEEKSKVGN